MFANTTISFAISPAIKIFLGYTDVVRNKKTFLHFYMPLTTVGVLIKNPKGCIYKALLILSHYPVIEQLSCE